MTNLRTWLGVALTTLGANPLRTLLSTLGVIMGIASLVAVLSIGDGLERFVRDQVARTTDLMSVMVMPATQDIVDGVAVPRADFKRFTEADVRAFATALGPDARVGIAVVGGSLVQVGDSLRGVVASAATPVMLERAHDTLAAGRTLSAAVRR